MWSDSDGTKKATGGYFPTSVGRKIRDKGLEFSTSVSKVI